MSEINGCGDEEIYGTLFPGWYLCRLVNAKCPYEINGFLMEEGHWGLTISNDPSFVFALDPVLDFTPEQKESEEYIEGEELIHKVARHYMERLIGGAEACHSLVSECIKAGYDPAVGGLGIWLSDYMYKHLEKRQWLPEEVYRA